MKRFQELVNCLARWTGVARDALPLRDVPAALIAQADKRGLSKISYYSSEFLIFITWQEETAEKAQKTLGGSNTLCNTDLGKIEGKLPNVLREMIDRAFKIEHTTCWLRATGCFAFITWNEKTAKKARKALSKAKLTDQNIFNVPSVKLPLH